MPNLRFNLDTWRTDVKPRDIEDAINHAAPGKLRVISVSEVTCYSINLQWNAKVQLDLGLLVFFFFFLL